MRFPDDIANSWKQVFILDIGSTSKGEILFKDEIEINGKYDCILYGELYTSYNEHIETVLSRTNKEISFNSSSNCLIFPSSTTVNALSLVSPTSLYNPNVILGGDMIIKKLNQDYDAHFTALAILKNKIKFAKLAQGSTIIHILSSDINKQKLWYPDIEIQKKISYFLSLIDKRIELQNKIIKDYELLKKLLMNKFLSNFNLREISIYSLVKSQLIRIIKASELKKFNGTKSYLSTSSIDENGSISPEKEISFFDRPSRASMIPYRNSVWFAKMKDTNKVYISKNNDEEKYILSTGFYGILPTKNDIDPIWLFEIFKSKYFIVQKDKLSEGGTMSGIKDSQLNELNIKIWLDKEMQNFACKLLKSFTKIIEIELGKENSLIKLKSYLLKTLFI